MARFQRRGFVLAKSPMALVEIICGGRDGDPLRPAITARPRRTSGDTSLPASRAVECSCGGSHQNNSAPFMILVRAPIDWKEYLRTPPRPPGWIRTGLTGFAQSRSGESRRID